MISFFYVNINKSWKLWYLKGCDKMIKNGYYALLFNMFYAIYIRTWQNALKIENFTPYPVNRLPIVHINIWLVWYHTNLLLIIKQHVISFVLPLFRDHKFSFVYLTPDLSHPGPKFNDLQENGLSNTKVAEIGIPGEHWDFSDGSKQGLWRLVVSKSWF